VQLAVERVGAAGGISITASHNPIQWNGMKFLAPTGMFLDAQENSRFWAMAEDPPSYVPWTSIGSLTTDTTWIHAHIDAVLALPYVERSTIERRRFRVVVDCVNAAGGIIVPTLLREFGCDVIEMNCDVSGVFSHTPEPIPENLTDLARRVRAQAADIGIAVDPDVDRLVLITERGEPYGEEYTIATATHFILKKWKEGKLPHWKQAKVVVNLSTTRAIDDIARTEGVEVIRTPVGEINVARKMKEIGSLIGGEGSGGVILADVHLGRDALVGIALIFQHLAEAGGTLSELKSSLPQYAIAKGKIAIKGISPDTVLNSMLERHGHEGTVSTDDGVKVDFSEYWVHLRKSNTEPIVRIIAEARTMERAKSVVETMSREIHDLMK
jgi:phosphomannomutase